MIKLNTTSGSWERFLDQIAALVRDSDISLSIDHHLVTGYSSSYLSNINIRSHGDILALGRYLQPGSQSAVDGFLMAQFRDGRVPQSVMTSPRNSTDDRENWEKWTHCPAVVDGECRLVLAAFLAWQATGDDEWLGRKLPGLTRAMHAIMASEAYWNRDQGLIMQQFATAHWPAPEAAQQGPGLFFRDNISFFEAANTLAGLYRHLGDPEAGQFWQEQAQGLSQRLNRRLYDGRFYRHFVALDPANDLDPDGPAWPGFGNVRAINCGMANEEWSRSILRAYQQKTGESLSLMQTWRCIDPPFSQSDFPELNQATELHGGGALWPLLGAELATACFNHGLAARGLDHLCLYRDAVEHHGHPHLCYQADGTPGTNHDTIDVVGAAQMARSLIFGLGGIADLDRDFRSVHLTPRWSLTAEEKVELHLSYADSGAGFGYQWLHVRSDRRIRMNFDIATGSVHCHVLLPPRTRPEKVHLNGRKILFDSPCLDEDGYVDFSIGETGHAQVEIEYSV